MSLKGLDKTVQSAKHQIKTMASNFTTCTDHVVLHDVPTADCK